MKITVTNSKSPIGISSVNVVRYESETNSDPYLFRSSPDVATHRKTLSELEGGTVAWNQHDNVESFTGVNGTFSLNGGILSLSNPNARYSRIQNYVTNAIVLNHKYLACGEVRANWAAGTDILMALNISTEQYAKSLIIAEANKWYSFEAVFHVDKAMGISARHLFQNNSAEYTGQAFDVRNPLFVDLTLMFGASIADYVYTLEQANAGSGIAWLKSYGYFTKDYYPYSAGELISVKTSGAKMVGFNAWDEEWEVGALDGEGRETASSTSIRSKNYTPCIAGASYYLRIPTGGAGIRFYDASKSYVGQVSTANATNKVWSVPEGAKYLRFVCNTTYGTTYNHDICINLAWDNSRNGEYKPYVEQTYPISDIDLRGIPTLDNGKIKYDGDTYAPDGTVTRKYGIVDLGTLTWTRYTTSVANKYRFHATLTGAKMPPSNSVIANIACSAFAAQTAGDTYDAKTGISLQYSSYILGAHGDAYDTLDAAGFKTAMSGIYLVYELETPTTETTDPYTSTQWVDKWGTESFIDERTIPMPVGNETVYQTGRR